jgi:hypothetical protein
VHLSIGLSAVEAPVGRSLKTVAAEHRMVERCGFVEALAFDVGAELNRMKKGVRYTHDEEIDQHQQVLPYHRAT